MAKVNTILVLIILAIAMILVIGAGCAPEQQQEQQQNQTQQQGQEQQQGQGQQQPSLLFSDDFQGYGTGATPTRWTSVMKDNIYASTKGMSQANGQYGLVLELKGKFFKTGDTNWKDYTIDTNFKIFNAGEHTGPEVMFRVRDDSNYYLISTNTQPT